MKRLKKTGIIIINYRVIYFSIIIVLALNIVSLKCQDISSEITLDKTTPLLSSKVKIRCTDDSLK